MSPESILVAYFYIPVIIYCVCIGIPPNTARQQLGGNITSVMKTHAAIEELLDMSFSMQFMLYQTKIGN
jgi:hypothetical protein